MAHRDRLLAGPREAGQEALDGRVEVEPTLVDQDHRDRRRDDDLGQAGEVVDRVGRDGGRALVVGEMAERGQVGQLAASPDGDDRAREGAARDVAFEQTVDLGEPLRREAGEVRTGRSELEATLRKVETRLPPDGGRGSSPAARPVARDSPSRTSTAARWLEASHRERAQVGSGTSGNCTSR